jgi:hypothetical protein
MGVLIFYIAQPQQPMAIDEDEEESEGQGKQEVEEEEEEELGENHLGIFCFKRLTSFLDQKSQASHSSNEGDQSEGRH